MTCRICLANRQIEREFSKDTRDSEGSLSPVSGNGKQLIPRGYFGHLEIQFIEGRGLVAADTNILGQKTSSDPYCVVTMSEDRTRRASKVVSSTLNPYWNETVRFPVRIPVQNIEIDIFDKDVTNVDDFIGRVSIPLHRLPNGKTLSGWLPIVYEGDNSAPISEILPAGSEGTIPAGAIRVSVKLDYRASSELKGYVRAAISTPPPPRVKFDINALYGPVMLAVELLWTRTLQPIVNALVYVLTWEDFFVSMLAMGVWVPLAQRAHLWTPAFFAALAAVILYHYVKRQLKILSNPLEAAEVKKKSSSRIARIPGIKQIGGAAKGLAQQVRLVPKQAGSNATTPLATAVVPAGEADLPADYEEQSLGSFVGKITVMLPGWVKEYVAFYQPMARSLGDLASMIYDIFHGNHESSLAVFAGLLALAAGSLYLPFHHFATVFGLLVILVTSPVMHICLGFMSYLRRARRVGDPAQLGFADTYSLIWLSKDAQNGRQKKLAKGVSTIVQR